MNSIVRTAGSLLVISGIAAAALGCINSVTKPTIDQRAEQTKKEAMQKVLPSADEFSEDKEVGSGVIKTYAEGTSGGSTAGYTFAVETKGFSSGLNLMVGIDKDGVVSGVTVVSHSETPGLGANAENVLSPQFAGKSGELSVKKGSDPSESEISAITGATITSNAVTNAVNEVQSYYNDNLKGGKG